MRLEIPAFLIRKDRTPEDGAPAPVVSPVGLPGSLEKKRQRAIAMLGERWLLHPVHAPRKGTYNNQGMKEEENSNG